MAELTELLEVAHEAVNIGREIAQSRVPSAVTAKGERDIATDVDFAIEGAMREFLTQETPEFGFLGEESGQNRTSALCWVLDPIDGTANFARQLPLTGISLGLAHETKSVLGVVDLPFLDRRYHAAEKMGAYCGTDRLEVRGTTTLTDAMISIGDYAVGDDADHKNHARFALTEFLARNVERVRMFGSAAIDLVWVAEGRTDGSIMLANKPWDTSAGTVIAREAGAMVVDIDGRRHSAQSSETIALAPGIAHETLSGLRSAISTP